MSDISLVEELTERLDGLQKQLHSLCESDILFSDPDKEYEVDLLMEHINNTVIELTKAISDING